MPQTHRPTITITGTAGNYVATIDGDHRRFKARPGHRIKWRVVHPENFPDDGVVFLQFVTKDGDQKTNAPDDGCLIDGRKNRGRHKGKRRGNDHFVTGHVALDAPKDGYHYQIWFHDRMGDHLLLDPEIIVDGNPDPTPFDDDDEYGKDQSRRGSARKTAQARPVTRSAAKQSAGKNRTNGAKKSGTRKRTARKAKAPRPAKRATRRQTTKRKKAKRTATKR